MDLNEWDPKVFVDMEGELRYALVDLDESREKYKKAKEKVAYLRELLDEGRNIMDDLETKLNDETEE